MEELNEREFCNCCKNVPCLWFIHAQTIVSTVKDELGDNFPPFVINWNPEINGIRENKMLMKDVLAEKSFDDVDETHRAIRFMCYSTYTRLVHGYLGRNNRKKPPSCVKEHIKNNWPDPNDIYVDFQENNDSN